MYSRVQQSQLRANGEGFIETIHVGVWPMLCKRRNVNLEKYQQLFRHSVHGLISEFGQILHCSRLQVTPSLRTLRLKKVPLNVNVMCTSVF